jgi:nitroimidazol reductase NimA-like FMN-containing flavoprotein (pyridoxamine 5'-phosphate oxidase superfamily)
MRRNEFNVQDKQSITKILSECEYGTLSLISQGKPYGVAVNFVWYNEKIFIHGALQGRKVDAINENHLASFLVVQAFSTIPSYFSNTMAACPATQFFASVHCEGTIKEIKTPQAKAIVLNKLMEKLQSEGKYEPIAYEKAIYTSMIDKTAIFELNPTQLSCKIKAGQNLSPEKFENMIQKLKERGEDIDTQTVKLMQTLQQNPQ